MGRTKVIGAERVDNVGSPNHHNHAHLDDIGPLHPVPYKNPYHRRTVLLPTTARTQRTLHVGWVTYASPSSLAVILSARQTAVIALKKATWVLRTFCAVGEFQVVFERCYVEGAVEVGGLGLCLFLVSRITNDCNHNRAPWSGRVGGHLGSLVCKSPNLKGLARVRAFTVASGWTF